MKILVLTEQFPPLVGGAPVAVYNFVRHWTDDHVIVVTARRPGAETFDHDQPFEVRRVWMWDGPIVGFHPIGWLWLAYFTLYCWRTLRNERPDAIYCGTIIPFAAILHWLLPQADCPVVVQAWGEDLGGFERVPWKARFVSRLLASADRVVVVGPYMEEFARQMGARPDGLVLVAPGVDATEFHPNLEKNEALRGRYGLHPHDKVLCTVARLEAHKGIDTAIKAVARLANSRPELRYLIVGDGPENESLKALAAVLGLKDVVIFAGLVSNEEIPSSYALADCFVMPNRLVKETGYFESFGISFIEASACGLPVIGSRSGGATDAIRHGKTGLLLDDPEDDAALAETIEALLADPPRAKAMGAAGRQWVLEAFDWETNSRSLRAVLHEAVEEQRE
ncbi:glycosyltransferase family 4 protein [Nitrospinae bacterium AH_259_B05_G02_I21]|nr:glycosyltransferase family 4 protein [Nitrospinae bacterium AH_259_B05_G02_I21]MDA2932524.1 glycosyltransferase family 4 protein [Nitrospinae bacterium AH-259-F20]